MLDVRNGIRLLSAKAFTFGTISSSFPRTSVAVAGRSRRRGSRHCSINLARRSGIPKRPDRIGARPAFGSRPLSIRYMTTPAEYTSARASTSRALLRCSGLIYSSVPTQIPERDPFAPGTLTIPKSHNFTLPRRLLSKSTFGGLISR